MSIFLVGNGPAHSVCMYTAGSTGVAEQAGLFPTVRFEVFAFCWWCGGGRCVAERQNRVMLRRASAAGTTNRLKSGVQGMVLTIPFVRFCGKLRVKRNAQERSLRGDLGIGAG